MPGITNLATNTTLNGKINEAIKEIPSITNWAITTALNPKINEFKSKILLLLLLIVIKSKKNWL